MLDRHDLEPVFFAPFVSSVMGVEPAWIDYNGHLNMAYYNVLFDRAVDEAFELLGCGLDYVKTRQHSCFTAEVHVRYLRELHVGNVGAVEWKQQQESGGGDRYAGRNGQPIDHLLTKIEASGRRMLGFDEPATLLNPFDIDPRQQIVPEEDHRDKDQPCHEGEADEVVQIFGSLGEIREYFRTDERQQ